MHHNVLLCCPTHNYMILFFKSIIFGQFCFLNTTLVNNIKSLFRSIMAHVYTHWKYWSWISTCNLFYLLHFGLNLTTLSLQLPKKIFLLYKYISIFPSQYKHSCEPITSKFKSWLFLSLASLENFWTSSWGETPWLSLKFFFPFICYFHSLCLDPVQMEHIFFYLLSYLFSISGTQW